MRISDWSSDVCSSDLSDLDVLVFADPQPKSHTDIDHYRRDIVEPLRGTSAALGLTLGDIVDDDLSLYPDINAVTSSPDVPWLHVAGNHDMRSEERRVVTQCVSTVRSRWSPAT